jgi:hypothetical protein
MRASTLQVARASCHRTDNEPTDDDAQASLSLVAAKRGRWAESAAASGPTVEGHVLEDERRLWHCHVNLCRMALNHGRTCCLDHVTC